MRLLFFVALLMCSVSLVSGAEDLEGAFDGTVRPFLKTYCVSCHNADDAEGDLDLESDRDVTSVVTHFRKWMVVMDRLEAGDMPPEDAEAHPTPEARKRVIEWIAGVRQKEAKRRAGDPGIVLARRLSNAEYNYTIRDLTGFDLQPAKAFPIDPANQEGFDNSGESLAMSPSLLKKYLDAARHVSEHLVLTPSGIDFAPHPVITETDRDKYCVNRIIDFYRRQRLQYVDFFYALWQYQLQHTAGDAETRSLREFASSQGLSPRYMEMLWNILNVDAAQDQATDQAADVGPLAALRIMWRRLPSGNTPDDADQAKRQCQRMEDFVQTLRGRLVPEVENLTTPEVHQGSQPLVLWKNRQFVANRRRYAGGISDVGDLGSLLELKPGSAEARAMALPDDEPRLQGYERTLETFCSVFPDTFLVSERARVYLDPKEEKERTGRFLSAGFHSQMGYFRDDGPLVELILSDEERKELDRLWLELDFVTSAPMRQYAGFIWFDRTDSRFMRDSQFDRFRAEDKDCTSEAKVRALAEAYLAKAERVGGNPPALEAIAFYFEDLSRTFRRLERLKRESESVQLDAVVRFAERAYRRPLTDAQRQSIRSFYRHLRESDGLEHEDAIRDSVVAVLMSPNFCYRLDLPQQRVADAAHQDVEPLDDFALASRLSYFLWASMPDQQLRDLAASGHLHQRDVLRSQVVRMLVDERSQGFVNEFVGSWLGFRQFQQHNGVDRNRFPQFTDELRQSMYEEPIRLFNEIVRTDGSILDLLYANYTFVDRALAEHYQFPTDRLDDQQDGWAKVDGVDRYGRGGLMPMAVFLTKNSPGLRTSPVQRGNWLVKYVLGEHIPAPPAAVPELPSDESQLGELTLREALQRHRADPSCAACHDKIDSFGLVFEQYGPIGERRETDFGGRQVDSHVRFPDESEGTGIEGLRDYIRRSRQSDFVDNFCRKLLAYALGRSLELSDETAIDQMTASLASNGYRLQHAIEMIVTSPAFLNKRVKAEF
ncbi:DUF1592 domain-containing protein [Planctomycetes bacterium TBK1r]|uniref:Planctomycete cytochrome C n=1 Tax=Stieleria magnilauensis TaxID=2527963 RepID=A0ABX5XVI7_9BACT|nr:hypothetical protein TBK1r_50340 [Planctomycetes bacterium TBK1r]